MSSARRMPRQRRHESEQVVETPRVFIDAVEARFGPLDVDLACSAVNQKAPARLHRDALKQPWDVLRGSLLHSRDIFRAHGSTFAYGGLHRHRTGLAFLLVPASIGSDWFRTSVQRDAMVLALSPRLTFVGHANAYPKDLILAVYGYGLRGFDSWRWHE